MDREVRRLDTGDGLMDLLAMLPEDHTSAPGVILCMHAPGVDSFIEEIARRLANAGFAAYAPDLYHRQAEQSPDPLARMAKLRDSELETDLGAVHTHLAEQGHARIGVVGFCMGGRIALIAASRLSPLDAAVSFYGGFIRESWGAGRPPIERVVAIDCPILLFGGALDTNPSPKDIEELSGALEGAGKQREVRMYEGVGHAFLNFNRPGYQEEKAMRAWGECEAFLKRNMLY